ncbi:MAG: hypothetical protein AAFY53_11290 [Pseudomonadota bacterium]
MLVACADQMQSPWSAATAVLALVRIAPANGVTRSELTRDLTPLLSHKLSPSEFRAELDGAVLALDEAGLIIEHRGRFRLTETGRQDVAARLGMASLSQRGSDPTDAADGWTEIRDQHLTALALQRPELPLTRKKLLAKPDGLRMAIVQRAFDLKLRRVPTPARIRAALAGVALKRVMRGELSTDIRVDGGVDAATGRALAAHLARRPRPFSSDTQLIAALAAEVIGAAQSDPATLRLVLIRQYVNTFGVGAVQADIGPPEQTQSVRADIDDGKALPDANEEASARMEAFVDAVLTAAENCSRGWAGNRKAFVSETYDLWSAGSGAARLELDDFKALLAEAHRTGHVTLAGADLKTPTELDALRRSEIPHRNTAWHFIRLDT